MTLSPYAANKITYYQARDIINEYKGDAYSKIYVSQLIIKIN